MRSYTFKTIKLTSQPPLSWACAQVDLDELLRLGDSFEKVKGRVPTR